MPEPTEVELTETDQADLLHLFGEPDGVSVEDTPEFHTVLEVWSKVLEPAEREKDLKPSPQWCNRMVQSYPGIRYADMLDFRDGYFGMIIELAAMLQAEIDTDSDCLSYRTPEDDARENATHYKQMLLTWQSAILQDELDWDCQDPKAAVQLAIISEVHKMFFGQEGITAYLDVIGFQFTEDDQVELGLALNELREAAL